MNVLPPSWAVASIVDVTSEFESTDPTAQPARQFRYVDIGSIDNVSQTITQPKVFLGRDAPSRARRVLKAGDVLFSTVRTYLKNIARVPEALDGELTSTGITILRPFAVDSAYLFHWARSDAFVSAVSRAQDGSMYPAVSDRDVLTATIPVAPLAEQRRIVAKLDDLLGRTARARKELDRVPKLVAQYKGVLLSLAFSGRLTEDWRAQHDELPAIAPRRSDQMRSKFVSVELENEKFEPPYGLPEAWRWLRLPELGDLDRGKSRHRPRNDPRLFGGSYPFVQTGDVRAADRYLRTFSQTYSEFGLVQSRLWPAGTLCITIAANIAETAILAIDACFPDSVVGFSADEERTTASYIEFFLRTAKAELASFAPATAQKNINLDTLAAIRVPVAPLEEQAEIIRRVENAFAWLDKLVAEHARAAHLLPCLEQALLAKAFRGELVPQDPNDEPATVLLERIRAERAAETPRATPQLSTPRAPRRLAAMTKSRQDPNVKLKPYLAGHLRDAGGSAKVEDLFRRADLPVADFYKQLAWEVEAGHVREQGPLLEAA